MAVTWPAANDDLLQPTKDYLQGLAVLENDTDSATAAAGSGKENAFVPFMPSKTPYSLQVISAGTLAFSQQAAKIVTALGGGAAILAAVKGIWFTSSPTEMAVIIGGAAVLLAALFVSVAMIVRADVNARAVAQAAEYDARGRIASTFLQTAERAHPDSAPDSVRKYWLRRTGSQAWQAVDRFEVGANGFVAVLADQNKTEVAPAAIDMVVYASLVS